MFPAGATENIFLDLGLFHHHVGLARAISDQNNTYAFAVRFLVNMRKEELAGRLLKLQPSLSSAGRPTQVRKTKGPSILVATVISFSHLVHTDG